MTKSDFLCYLLESSAALAVFYGLYRLLLHGETFFAFNRAFILGGIGLSLVLPLVEIRVPFLRTSAAPGPVAMLGLMPETPLPGSLPEAFPTVPVDGLMDFFQWDTLAFGVYMVVAGLLLGRFLLRLWKLYRLIHSQPAEPGEGYYLIETGGKLPTFSFFHWLFWDNSRQLSSEETEQVMGHELTHIRQWHSLDVMLLEMVTIGCWFNPVMHLFARHLRTIHEYLADREASQEGSSQEYLQLVATQLLHHVHPALIHPFNQSQLINRMAMLRTLSHTQPAFWKAGVSLTAVILFSCLYACRSTEMAEPKATRGVVDASKNQPAASGKVAVEGTITVDGKPLSGAIVLVKGATIGTTTDRNGKYTITTPANSTLVYSFVGYQTEQMPVSGKAIMDVQLIRNVHALPEVGAKTGSDSVPSRPKLYEQPFASKDNGIPLAKDGTVFQVVEQMPEFPGGINGLRWYFEDHLQYPTQAREKKVAGAVFINFTVQADGTVTDAKVLRGLGSGCDEEALRVVQKMPQWQPGRQNGQAVSVSYSLPVRFQL